VWFLLLAIASEPDGARLHSHCRRRTKEDEVSKATRHRPADRPRRSRKTSQQGVPRCTDTGNEMSTVEREATHHKETRVHERVASHRMHQNTTTPHCRTKRCLIAVQRDAAPTPSADQPPQNHTSANAMDGEAPRMTTARERRPTSSQRDGIQQPKAQSNRRQGTYDCVEMGRNVSGSRRGVCWGQTDLKSQHPLQSAGTRAFARR